VLALTLSPLGWERDVCLLYRALWVWKSGDCPLQSPLVWEGCMHSPQALVGHSGLPDNLLSAARVFWTGSFRFGLAVLDLDWQFL